VVDDLTTTFTTRNETAIPLNLEALLLWESATSQFVTDAYANEKSISNLVVETTVVSQSPEHVPNTSTPTATYRSNNNLRGRKIQTMASNEIEIKYTQTISYYTSIPNGGITPEEISTDPFSNLIRRRNYISALQETNNMAFEQIKTASSVKIIPSYKSLPQARSPPEKMSNRKMYIMIAGGVTAAVIVIVGVFFRKQNTRARKHQKMLGGKGVMKKKQSSNHGTLNDPSGVGIHPDPNADARVETFIYAESSDDTDVSTLGDPLGFLGPGPTQLTSKDSQRDEKTVGENTLNDAFDYANTYGGPQQPPSFTKRSEFNIPPTPTSSRLVYGTEDPLFSDEASFDEQFGTSDMGREATRVEVNCPSGKLGVIIDTIDSGLPGVNSIKPESVLVGQVQVGDVLISVDGVDTMGMSAMQVSRMIGSRSNNPSRVLVFIRHD